MKKINLLVLMLLALFFTNFIQAQVNIGGTPKSYEFEKNGTLESLTFIQTPSLNMETIEAEDAQWEAERLAGGTKIGRRFGIELEVDYDLYNSGTWTFFPDGTELWRLGIECPEALSINLIFDRYRLPEGATLYIYSVNKQDLIGGFTNYNNQADYFFATDIVIGDKIVIEYFQPANTEFEAELKLGTIVHGYRSTWNNEKGYGQSGSCQRNTKCPEGDGWEDQVRSTFALYSGGMELCSGCIVNNTANDKKPYALTANHCWNAAQNPGVWVFRFRWESPQCTPTQNTTYKTMTGSTLRAKTPTSTSATDACLVELNQPIPDDYDVYFAGWSRSTVPSTIGMCIHHPSLDIKKITPSNPLFTVTQYVQGWRANWSTNACTEPGSSGSPLFDSNHRVVGQEYGGQSACNTYGTGSHFDVYGRFDISWNYGTSSSTRLKDWLDPLELNPETLDGLHNHPFFDAQLVEINAPNGTIYIEETIEPSITIKNVGNQPITSAIVSYIINDEPKVTKEWTGTIAENATATITFEPITLTLGSHSFNASVSVSEDENAENDTLSVNFNVKDCLPVSNITAAQTNEIIEVRWDTPENTEGYIAGYIFYMNGDSIDTVIEPVYTFENAGLAEYEFCVVVIYNYEWEWCNESPKECITAVSIKELSQNNVKIYPNPTNSQIFIEGVSIQSVELFNMQGKLIYSEKGDVKKIDVSKYAQGNYLIKVTTVEGQKVSQQITIIR